MSENVIIGCTGGYMKGIVLNYKMIKQISEHKPERLTNEDIAKINKLEDKNVSITKREFIQIISVLESIIEKRGFSKLPDSQLFFVNFSNSISEFDVLIILKDKGGNVIVNIEVKSLHGVVEKEEVKTKLKKQVINKVDEHLPQMFIEDKYMVLGYIDNEYNYGFFKENDKNKKELTENEALNYLSELHFNGQANLILQMSDKLSDIQNVYRKMKNGTFKMYAINKRILEKINNALQIKQVIMCLAKPGYGKTVLALDLFFNNPRTKLLILNQKFYYTFSMTEYYSHNRAFYGTDAFIEHLEEDTVAIIDEAQRLSKSQLKSIIDNSKKVIIFGDTSQAFNETDEFIDEVTYEEAVRNCVDEDYEIIKLKNPIRYSDEVDRALKYLYDRRAEKRDLRKLRNFKIAVYNAEDEFFKEYNSIQGNKKIYKMYTSPTLYKNIVVDVNGGTFTYSLAPKDVWNFAVLGNIPLFGHTHHAISFDSENVFLYLDNLVYSEERKSPVANNINVEDDEKYKKYLNELEILLTRARKSLHIYVNDLKSYLWFNEKITDINNATDK